MVSMATINMILEHGGVHTKLVIPRCSLSKTTEPGFILKRKTKPFQPMVRNAIHLTCIFINFNENIKMTEKIVKNTLINYFRTKLSM